MSQDVSVIDWTNPKAKVSKYFTVRECLWLPQWNRMATELDGLNDEIKHNLFVLCNKIDVIREKADKPFKVHCMYRPEAYNTLVKGAKNSAHKSGQAIDLSIEGINCDEARRAIIEHDYLNKLELRMEDLPKSNWIHLDTRTPGASGKRFFKP